jgi:hypothetical protein
MKTFVVNAAMLHPDWDHKGYVFDNISVTFTHHRGSGQEPYLEWDIGVQGHSDGQYSGISEWYLTGVLLSSEKHRWTVPFGGFMTSCGQLSTNRTDLVKPPALDGVDYSKFQTFEYLDIQFAGNIESC